MSRISEIVTAKGNRLLNVYCTAGYPALHSTPAIMKALQQHGADLVEIGIPYSDPLADGPVIQHSSTVALANGMTIAILLEQLRQIKNEINIPVILMGYMNPVLQFGFEKFCAEAAAAGVDGLILPDLPAYEFETEYGPIVRKYALDFIFLITPETSDERVRQLDGLSSGFLYAVSSSSTTGGSQQPAAITDYLNRLRSMELKNPVLVGFGISNKASFDAICRLAAGGIIGSAYIKALENSPDLDAATAAFLSSITG